MVCHRHHYQDLRVFHKVIYSHSRISCFLLMISSCCLFSSISICVGLHSLVFRFVVERPRLKSSRLTNRYSNQLMFTSMVSNILAMIESTRHPILSTRRGRFGITSLLSFNHQAIIWNIGRNGFVS